MFCCFFGNTALGSALYAFSQFMPKQKDDNLFAESAMSFGEHLEELRKCLINSLYWTACGFAFGLLLGIPVVKYIQIPVEASLEKYYSRQDLAKLELKAKKLKEVDGQPEEIFTVLAKHKMNPVELYIFPGEFERATERQRAQQKDGTASGLSALRNIDNLVNWKKTLERKRAEAFDGLYAFGPTPQLDKEPVSILFWSKIDDDTRTKTKALGVYEAFAIYIKASLVLGVVIASPGIVWNLWSFIAAGLYPHEKKYVYYFVPVSILLFVGGASFAFFCVFQFVLDFLFSFNAMMGIDPDPRISEWIGFALLLPVGFGASFQLPLVLFVLERVGIFTVEQYISSWRISVLAIFLLSLLLTPGDPGSMLLMAFPLTILYFGGVFFCWLIPRKKGIFDLEETD